MLLLIPILLPVLSGTVILIKKWKKKPWRRDRFILVSALVNSAVVLGFLIAQYSETVNIAIAGPVSFELAIDGLGSVFAGCIAVIVPAVLCYFLAPETDADSGEKKLRAEAPSVRQTSSKEEKNAQAERKRDTVSAPLNYLFAALTGFSFSKNAATAGFFLIIILLIALWMVWMSENPGKCWLIFYGSSAAALLIVLAAVVFGGEGEAFYFNGFLSGKMSDAPLLLLYVLSFLACSVCAVVYPIVAALQKADAGEDRKIARTELSAEKKSGSAQTEKIKGASEWKKKIARQITNLLVNGAMAFLLIRLTFSVFGISLLRGSWVQVVLVLLAAAAVCVYAVMTLRERDPEQKFSYISAASFALILAGIAVMTSHGCVAAVWTLIAFLSVQILLTLFSGVLKNKNIDREQSLPGLARQMPVTFGCYVTACLSLGAFPPLAGFLSVWKLAKAETHQGGLNYLSLAAMFVFLFMAIYSLYPLIIQAFFPKNEMAGKKQVDEVNLKMLVPMLVLAAALIAVGIFSGALGEYIYQIGLGVI